MPGTRAAPKDQELFASTLLGLRAFESGNPRNAFEQGIVDQMQANDVDKDAVHQLTSNVDRLAPAIRRRALGDFGREGYVPQRGSRAGLEPASGTRSFVRPPAFIRETLDRVGGVFLDPGAPRPAADPTYEIRYAGFHCDEEVGDPGDWIAETSDEVYMVASTVNILSDGSNVVRTTKHPIDRDEYGDVDIGETRLGPVVSCWKGTVFPVSLTAVAFERDYGDPDKYRDEIHAAVVAAIAASYLIFGPGALAVAVLEKFSEQITDLINWIIDTEDDQVDIPRTVVMDQAFMEALGRDGPKTHWHVQQLPFGLEPIRYATPLRYHLKTAHSGLGGRYTFGFELIRDPAFVIEPPVVD